MEYLNKLICCVSLPIMVWVAVKFVNWNLKAFNENLEAFRK